MMSAPTLSETRPRVAHPLFSCAWDRAVFLHYRVPPECLQKQVPFDLDLFDNYAYVSLVAFTLRGLRMTHASLNFLTLPMRTHNFLNVRTYVHSAENRGIYFLAEWLNNRLATTLGPILYGLPYRFGSLTYRHNPSAPTLTGQVKDSHALLRYRATLPRDPTYQPSEPHTLDHFLLERYTAFTQHGPIRRLFNVHHAPWPQTPITAEILDDSLLHRTGPWFPHAQFIGANFSRGVSDVQMGWPIKIPTAPA